MKTHITCHPVRSEITTQRSPLAGYLAGALGTIGLLGAAQTEAAVTAVTFGFGSQFNATDGTSNWLVNSPDLGNFGSLWGAATPAYLYLGNPYAQGGVYSNGGYGGNIGLMRFFGDGTLIGAGGNGTFGGAFAQDGSPGLQLATDQLNKNIAFQTSSHNWGWANVSWTEADKTLTINSAYVESVAGNSITVGDVGAVPEPSRALLALAGLAAVGLRRRRKQAA